MQADAYKRAREADSRAQAARRIALRYGRAGNWTKLVLWAHRWDKRQRVAKQLSDAILQED